LRHLEKYAGFLWFLPVLTVVLFFKLRDLKNFTEENVLSCYDCLWFARLAEDFYEGKFSKIDYLTNVPDFAVVPLSLIIVFPVVLSKMISIEMNKIFLYAPPIMGTLFVIPMYYWIRNFAPVYVFVGGAFLGLFNYVYYYRTTLGRYDTDFLILFFVFLILLLFTKAIFQKNRSYFFVLLAGIVSQIFMWWYYKPILLVFLLSGLLIGLLVNRENPKEIVKKVLLYAVVSNPFSVFEGLSSFGHYFFGYFLKEESFLPVSITANIIELQPVNFNKFLYMTVDHTGILILSVLGLAALLIFKFRYMAVALPIILIGLTIFTAGERFLMYLAPFLGMGIGYVIYGMNWYIKRVLTSDYLKKIVTILFVIITAFFSTNSNAFVYNVKPTLNESFLRVVPDLKEKLTEGAYVWQWWDYGNIVEYYLEKGTYIDNHNFHPFKVYAVAHSLMIYDEKKARNIIAFVTNNLSRYYMPVKPKKEDLKKIRENAINYNEHLEKDVYVFLYPADINKEIILQLGVYGAEEYIGDISLRRAFYKCLSEDEFFNCGRFEFHKFLTIFNWKDKSYEKNNPYAEVRYIELDRDGQILKKTMWENSDKSKRLILQFIRQKNDMFVFITDKKFAKSLFSRMAVAENDFRCFDLVYNGFPFVIVYKVNPDKNCQ